MTNWQPGMVITAARLNDGLDPVTTASGLVAGTGFSVNDFRAARLGDLVVLDMYVQRTGGTLTATNGNLAGANEVPACTAPAGWCPTNGTINGDWDDGTSEGGFAIGNDGICTLRTASSDITTSRNLRLHVAFIQT